MAKNVCASCHPGIAKAFATSLHRTTAAVSDARAAVVLARARSEDLAALKPALDNHCSACHITGCGDCHLSRPNWSGGGLVDGHNIRKTPNSITNCTACHGSRIEKEMMAEAPETVEPRPKADVHWSPKGMQCVACHKEGPLHGSGEKAPANRYADGSAPSCENCHDITKG
ncbi:MAG TPA: multiheme c-type cytochrome, partial [Bacillota bacterium]